MRQTLPPFPCATRPHNATVRARHPILTLCQCLYASLLLSSSSCCIILRWLTFVSRAEVVHNWALCEQLPVDLATHLQLLIAVHLLAQTRLRPADQSTAQPPPSSVTTYFSFFLSFSYLSCSLFIYKETMHYSYVYAISTQPMC